MGSKSSVQNIALEVFEEIARIIDDKSIPVKRVGFCQRCGDVTAFRHCDSALDRNGANNKIECAVCECQFVADQKNPQQGPYHYCGIYSYFCDLEHPRVPERARERAKEFYKPERQLEALLSGLQKIVSRKELSIETLQQEIKRMEKLKRKIQKSLRSL